MSRPSPRRLAPLVVALAVVGGCARQPERGPATNRGVILLTGFEPFGGGQVNASWEAVKNLNGRTVRGYRLVARQLPVVWGQPLVHLKRLVREHKPVAVFSFGQGHPGKFYFERAPRNLRAPLKDNQDRLPPTRHSLKDAPRRYAARYPFAALQARLKKSGLPVAASTNAGAYLCEECAFALEYLRRRPRSKFAAAFFHVPPRLSPLKVKGRTVKCGNALLRQFARAVVDAWIDTPAAGRRKKKAKKAAK